MAQRKRAPARARVRPHKRNPLAPESYGDTNVNEYDVYVGSIITPKIKMPVSVFVGRPSDRFIVTTPDRKLLVGAGYYGEHNGPLNCTRQHMLPGLVDTRDQGTGLGTSLYIAGNMVVAAANEAGRKFPWRMDSSSCTFSLTGDRYSTADRAWTNMRRHGLATVEVEETEGEEEYEDETDISDFLDEDYITQSYQERGEGITISRVSIDGTVSVRGTKEGTVETEVDVMFFETIRNSGLILDLSSEYFEDDSDFRWTPPEVFGGLDWSHTPDATFLDFAEANNPKSSDEERNRDWIRAAACKLIGRGDDGRAELLLETIGEHRQLGMFQEATSNPRRNPELCPTQFRKASSTWEKQWGESFEEDVPVAERTTHRRRFPMSRLRKVMRSMTGGR